MKIIDDETRRLYHEMSSGQRCQLAAGEEE